MFNKWMKNNKMLGTDMTSPIFPKGDDRAFWESKYSSDYIRKAEKYLGCDWPIIRATEHMAYFTEGNRRAMEEPHFTRRNALCTLVMGEIAEYKGRFIPDIVDGIFAICEESFWGVSAHSVCVNIPDGDKSVECIDLFAAETGSLIAIACYILGDELREYCPQILDRAEAELCRRIIEPYRSRTDFYWMGYGYPVNNWNAWILSNVLTVYLLCERDKWKLAFAINKMMTEINRLYETYPDDGGCDEGACYWAVSGGCLFEFCELLYLASAGKVNFFEDEKLRRICRYIVKNYIGDGYFVNFADGSPKINHSLAGLLYMMGLRTGDSDLVALAGETYRNDPERENMTPFLERDAKIRRRLWEMINEENIATAGGLTLPETDILPCLENAFIRRDGWTVAAKGGTNGENHNHNDVGSFIAYCGGEPVLVDPSCGIYVGGSFSGGRYDIWTNRSEWHNTPDICGVMQKDGKEYKADSFTLDGQTVSVSFGGAYPHEAGDVSVIRRITVDSCAVEIRDHIELAGGTVTENFVTPLAVTVEDDGVIIGGRYVLSCNVSAGITVDYADFFGDDKLTMFWKTDRMTRIRFSIDVKDAATVGFTLRER